MQGKLYSARASGHALTIQPYKTAETYEELLDSEGNH